MFGIFEIGNLALMLPIYLVWLAGLIWAVASWKKHPKVSLLATLGLAMFLIQAIVSGLTGPLLQRWIARTFALRAFAALLAVRGIFAVVLQLLGWVLLLAAVFIERDTGSAVDQPTI